MKLIKAIALMVLAFMYLLIPDAIPQNMINFTAFVWLANIMIRYKEEK